MTQRLRRLLTNGVIALVSTWLSLNGGLFLVDRWVASQGGNIEARIMLAPRPHMWLPDARAGYRNKPHLDHAVFGGIRGRTNAFGFRMDRDPARGGERKGARVFGIGDSVTWGLAVSREDAYLGVLERNARLAGHDLEVVNAGVIGYASYQEQAFLSDHVKPWRPDIVLLNYCRNDWMPSEDPFRNLLGIYRGYLREHAAAHPDPTGALYSLAQSPWKVARERQLDHQPDDPVRRALVEAPLQNMAKQVESWGGRLVVLFIPSARPSSADGLQLSTLKRHCGEHGIAYLDLEPALREDSSVYESDVEFEDGLVYRALSSRPGQALRRYGVLPGLDPVPILERLGSLRALKRSHERRNFIDGRAHPSRRGHRLIGEALFRYLDAEGLLGVWSHVPEP